MTHHDPIASIEAAARTGQPLTAADALALVEQLRQARQLVKDLRRYREWRGVALFEQQAVERLMELFR